MFLAHAQSGDGEAERQPVLITVEDENPNGAQILFCVGGAGPSDWASVSSLARVVMLFDGRDAARWTRPAPPGREPATPAMM